MAAVESVLTRVRARAQAAVRDQKSTETGALAAEDHSRRAKARLKKAKKDFKKASKGARKARAAADAARKAFSKASARARQEERRAAKARKAGPESKISTPRPKAVPRKPIQKRLQRRPLPVAAIEIGEAELN